MPAYTVTDMLTSINSVMEPIGGKVELKRSARDGIALDTSAAEVEALDAKARIKSAADSISQLNRIEKMNWMTMEKEKGNQLYQLKQYQEACCVYVEACVGLDFGTTESEKVQMQQEYQLPLTCNIAACLLALKKWKKVVDICTEVLRIDANCVKALRRRGMAYAELDKFTLARQDLERAVALDPSMEKELQKLKQKTQVYSLEREKQRVRMKKAVGELYRDKEPVAAPVVQTWFQWVLSCCFGRRKLKPKQV